MSFTSAPNTTYPYSAVVYLLVQDTNGAYWQGSGVMISPNEILTAAHVVDQARSIEVVPGATATRAPYGIAYASSWTYDPNFRDSTLLSPQQSQNDVGLIRLPNDLGDATGWMGLQADFGSGQVSLTGYPGAFGGNLVTETVGIGPDPGGSVLDYPLGSVSPGASGGPLWINGNNGPQVVGVVSTSGWAAQITPSLYSYIENDVALHAVTAVNPGPSASTVSYTDVTTGASGTAPAPAYSGPVNYLDSQYIYFGSDDLAVAATTPNVFLHGGSGNDALKASSGQNVLDGGTGSNFLVGGTGTDTFFVDGRGSGVTWSTLVNFHFGDAAILWGFVPGVSTLSWVPSDGAAGSQGSTLHAALAGGNINVSMTFANLGPDVTGHFTVQAGASNGSPYLQITYT